jgi:hypothetical protein
MKTHDIALHSTVFHFNSLTVPNICLWFSSVGSGESPENTQCITRNLIPSYYTITSYIIAHILPFIFNGYANY